MDVEVQIGSWVVMVNGEPFATCDSAERASSLAAILAQHASYQNALKEVMDRRNDSGDQALIARAMCGIAKRALDPNERALQE